MNRVTKDLTISGRVQGVGFRYSMRDAAERIGVTGWVANRADGSVAACVQGAPEQVDEIIGWARRGPPAARVERVEVSEARGDFDRFTVEPSRLW